MTTSICHLILFIILAVALSDLCLPIAGFNTAECYIMIMSGLGAGMLSASHSGRMKWINIPEGAESGCSACGRDCECVCVCRQTALGDQSAPLLLASNSISFCFSHTHTAVFVSACRGSEWTVLSVATFRCRNSIITHFVSL